MYFKALVLGEGKTAVHALLKRFLSASDLLVFRGAELEEGRITRSSKEADQQEYCCMRVARAKEE